MNTKGHFIIVALTGLIVGFLGLVQAQNISLTVLTPNGGECYIPGSEVEINWSGSGFDHVAIGYQLDDTTPPTWQNDASAWSLHPVYAPPFKWTVPDITSKTVKIWVEAHNPNHSKLTADSSNNAFTISDICGVEEPSVPTSPTINEIRVETIVYKATDTVEVQQGKNLILIGTSKAGETITIYVASTEKKFDVAADSTGGWTFEVWTKDLKEGSHQIDLESADSPRAKALTFRVIPVGQEPTPPATEDSPAIAARDDKPSAIQRSALPFPYVPVAISAASLIAVGTLTYLFVRRRTKPLNEAPVEPPQIT